MGFIGSNFLNIYVPKYKNYFFVNVDCLTSAGDIANVSVGGENNYKFEKVDIRDKVSLEEVFSSNQITDIIHFAAESYVDASIEDPRLFIETNILGTHNLLELARKYKINRFLQISTDEVYGSLKVGEKSFDRNSPLLPNNPYSASKASADLIVRMYHEMYGLNTLISRCTNNYGPNQDFTKLVPKFMKLLLEDKKVPLHAKGEHIRDWIYVEDHAEAIDIIFHKGISGGVYNIGANNELTNKEITDQILALAGKDESSIEYVPDRMGNDFRYSINTDELSKELGWKAKTSFEEGIKKTFEFYKNKFNAK
jgi:dTDP-glucose 4,6-dehydratase